MNLMEDLELNLMARLNNEFGIGIALLIMPSVLFSIIPIAYGLEGTPVSVVEMVIAIGVPFILMVEAMHLNANSIRKRHTLES